jgi:hypothetical protein
MLSSNASDDTYNCASSGREIVSEVAERYWEGEAESYQEGKDFGSLSDLLLASEHNLMVKWPSRVYI